MVKLDGKESSGTVRQVAREISYSHSAETKSGRVFIRSVENLTGRIGLIRQAKGYGDEVRAGNDFWQVMLDRYRLTLNVVSGSLDNIPKDGPAIVIANHPYGILDGLMMGHILSKTRGDFRILANTVFKNAGDINRVILPISFDESRAAVKKNLETRRLASSYLQEGGVIGIFPGGTVSTSAKAFGVPMDPGWRTFTAKLVKKSGATVVPIFFDGTNSRLFQLASHLHSTLRTALFINEFRRRVGGGVNIVVGEPFGTDHLAEFDDARGLMDYLREQTYRLSPVPLPDLSYGYEFEDHHRSIA